MNKSTSGKFDLLRLVLGAWMIVGALIVVGSIIFALQMGSIAPLMFRLGIIMQGLLVGALVSTMAAVGRVHLRNQAEGIDLAKVQINELRALNHFVRQGN